MLQTISSDPSEQSLEPSHFLETVWTPLYNIIIFLTLFINDKKKNQLINQTVADTYLLFIVSFLPMDIYAFTIVTVELIFLTVGEADSCFIAAIVRAAIIFTHISFEGSLEKFKFREFFFSITRKVKCYVRKNLWTKNLTEIQTPPICKTIFLLSAFAFQSHKKIISPIINVSLFAKIVAESSEPNCVNRQPDRDGSYLAMDPCSPTHRRLGSPRLQPLVLIGKKTRSKPDPLQKPLRYSFARPSIWQKNAPFSKQL